jgi:hypothetical protein
MTDRELMRQAVVALDLAMLHGEFPQSDGILRDISNAANALSARLAQPEPEQLGEIVPADEEQLKRIAKLVAPEPEPVAWIVSNSEYDDEFVNNQSALAGRYHRGGNPTPVYIAPPQREWQGLTHEEIAEESGAAKAQNHMVLTLAEGFFCGARWAEAKLKEKNT